MNDPSDPRNCRFYLKETRECGVHNSATLEEALLKGHITACDLSQQKGIDSKPAEWQNCDRYGVGCAYLNSGSEKRKVADNSEKPLDV